MFTQTIAIFVDAYRELNARKLFWIVLSISGLVVLAFAGIGIDQNGVYIFGAKFAAWMNTDVMPRADFYKMLFQDAGITVWLTWAATILAIVSTAGIFPDLLSGGTLEMYFSKPISRLKLFVLKYISGLLFVTLQVAVFCSACFLVIGFRGGVWEPGLFIAVPLIVCFFSYLFCICVLLGVLTRSTMAAALLTLLLWFGIFAVSIADKVILTKKFETQQRIALIKRQTTAIERQIATLQQNGMPAARSPGADPRLNLQTQSSQQKQALDNEASSLAFWNVFQRGAYISMTALPKTGGTMDLLTRELIREAHLKKPPDGADDSYQSSYRGGDAVDPFKTAALVNDELQQRSIRWVVGTSLLFEAVILAIAAWKFCRLEG